MLGVIAIIVALVLFPVAITVGGGVIAAILGFFLQADGERRNADSEMLALDD